MSEHSDYLYALELQNALNQKTDDDDDVDEAKASSSKKAIPTFQKGSKYYSNMDAAYISRMDNLVHPDWEALDPTPDITALFGAFDSKFFQNRLKCVTLEWSKRMYSCAGICYSRKNRFGKAITIRLSEPLLKLRPRKDLVETMLHEMIHAYCFVLNIREGNGGHGPCFKKIMQGINKVAGTNITVYHSFYNEVNVYKTHWWRCNGSCQNRSPFYGYVKRTSNRAPGPNDQWWAQHMKACGGTFMKMKEPEKTNIKASKSTRKQSKAGVDLRKFFTPRPTESDSSNNMSKLTNTNVVKGNIKTNGGGTLLINPNTKGTSNVAGGRIPSISTLFPPTSYPGLSSDPFNMNRSSSTSTGRSLSATSGGNLSNVKSLNDLTSCSEGLSNKVKNSSTFNETEGQFGRGYSLQSSSHTMKVSNTASKRNEDNINRKHVRDIWSKRFANTGKNVNTDDDEEKSSKNQNKRRRVSQEATTPCANQESRNDASQKWVVIDNDLMLQEKTKEIISISSDDDSEASNEEGTPTPALKSERVSAEERQNAIKREILDESMDIDLTNDDIILIDDDYNDDEDLLNTSAAAELADTSLIDDLFGDDTLLEEFKKENDLHTAGEADVMNPFDDIITCPICQGKMKRSAFAEHLDGCTGIAIKVQPPKHALKKLADASKQLKPSRHRNVPRWSKKTILHNAGYTDEDLAGIVLSSDTDENDSSASSTPSLRNNASSSINFDLPDESSIRYRQRNLFKTTRQCPVCARDIEEDEINNHLDECLKKIS